MSEGEDYVINAYWEETRAPGSQGAIYRNFKIIESGEGRRERRADAVVVESKSADEGHVHDLPDLDSRDVTVLQAKVTGLNAWLFGQALFSPKLMARSAQEQNWRLGDVCSVALCDANKKRPELQALIESRFSDEVRICLRSVPTKYQSNRTSVTRIPDVASMYAKDRHDGMLITEDVCLTTGLSITGIFVLGLTPEEYCRSMSWREWVYGRTILAIHSEQVQKGSQWNPAMSAMYMAGEIIIAQLLLTEKFHAASVKSVIACADMDRAVACELREYAAFELWKI